ncbi:MAG: efflux transporter outer membrane subunit [Candidatus Omnitrophica bacterium]|nr:efflux transporter outer membrane subunit [Candidatus Omnitrophota bacterium]
MRFSTKNNIIILTITIFFTAIGNSYAIGPNFKRPAAPNVARYTNDDRMPNLPEPISQKFIYEQNIPAEWWALFRCKKLDQVIRLAIDGNPTLAAAKATLQKAKEEYTAKTGVAYFPNISADLSMSRQKTSTAAAGISEGKGTIFNFYGASVKISYLFDVWGGARRELEALQSQVNFQDLQLQAAYLTITSNIVASVGKEVAIRGQINAMKAVIDIQEKQLALIEKQLDLGGADRSQVLAQKTALEQTKAQLPALDRELAYTRHQLAVLVGKFPNEESTLPEFDLSELTLPQDLPVTLPSELVRKRPDIRMSEELLHAACAEIGVATANMYPQFILNSGFGPESNTIKELFNGNNIIWNIGANIVQPIFRGGELKAKKRAALAAFDQAAAEYRQTVLYAFQNVADVLRALETDAATFEAQIAAFNTAEEYFKLAKEQFNNGAVSIFILLDAERQFNLTRIGVVQAQAARFADTAALFQALGGGWWNNAN